MKKALKLFAVAVLAVSCAAVFAACDFFGSSEPDGPADYSPNAGEYSYFSGFTIKTPAVNSYEEYTSDTLDEIFGEYEALLKEEVPKLGQTWLTPPFTGTNQLINDSVQWRLDRVYRLISAFTDTGSNNTLTLELTVDETAKTGTLGFREGILESEYLWHYEDIPFSYDDTDGEMTITGSTADADELKLDGFLKFSYEDGDVTMAFDISGYLKAAAADGLNGGEKASLPILTLAFDFT